MARSTRSGGAGRKSPPRSGTGRGRDRPAASPVKRARRWAIRQALRLFGVFVILLFLAILIFRFVAPPTTWTMVSEGRRLDGITREWVPVDEIAPVMLRSAVAAEDANFCLHWGFDMSAIRRALNEGAIRGASTLSQQTVKNVFLWQHRSWARKALEAGITPVAEIVWPKRRILELYLNVAEFGEGIFGIEAAANFYFGTTAAKLTARQAGLLAAALPAPKARNPSAPPDWMRRRGAAIEDGAATIARDGRAACFED
ncbi:monofunctional biosynthetic peptidoglycan transglycosylase [Roseicyclus sp. F158]|uniref:Biosynthetic peptidoglycan transglycosylase n=1 Tax=Tropicimonas omnivorans TaxID=3075590 RepID=A0ABU3DDR2_9RHOB|nr:monofunctional biosynthetic peptidoglycan transglycosylase [Roseicyclus sp. F158]MDT0681849.1 monofunctional biosynthetic peptidoglycan transglycosylase [Roseicyclus sp. F158]